MRLIAASLVALIMVNASFAKGGRGGHHSSGFSNLPVHTRPHDNLVKRTEPKSKTEEMFKVKEIKFPKDKPVDVKPPKPGTYISGGE